MIDLYTYRTSNGRKVSIMLEECGLPYATQIVDITAGDQHAPDFLAISPNGRIPALVDPHGPAGTPLSLFESGAILLYLADKIGLFLPDDDDGRWTAVEWLMWQMGGFGPMLGQAHHFNYYAPEKVDYAMKRYSVEANRLYGVLDRRLAKTKYVAGEVYSIADIAILPWTRTYQRQNVTIEDYPHVVAWRQELGSRDAVVAGMKVGAQWREDLKTLNAEDFAKLFGTK